MISRRFVKIAVSGLVLGLSLTGGHPVTSPQSGSSAEAKQLQIASAAAAQATGALAAQDYRKAIISAETAVEYAPRDAAYRMLLGQAYQGAGRFSSAETSFSDTLTLSPDNGRAALNLALMQVAQGKRDSAMVTLTDYREKMAASDYGLALALAGDAPLAVRTLEAAIRGGGVDAKTRQNLALAYALADQWAEARVMASQDLSATDVETRIVQWAGFVRPAGSYDQVASLLGVRPVLDAGQPTRLALNAFADTAVAAADPSPGFNEPTVTQPPVQTAMAEVPAFETPVPVQPSVAMNERREIVQPLPASYANPVPTFQTASLAARVAPVASRAAQPLQPRRVGAGKFVVQLGAYENAAVSRDAWKRVSSRYSLGNFDPANSAIRVGNATFVRLSVGGFNSRAEANGVCSRIRNAGGTCFVRGLLGDAPAQWVQRGMPKSVKQVRVASR